jgi:hypothetical protein
VVLNKQVEARCGLQVIDWRSGDIVHALQIEGVISELYDVAVLPGVQRPMALGLKTDEIRRVITIPPNQYYQKSKKRQVKSEIKSDKS